MKTNPPTAVLAAHAQTIATARHLILRRAWPWTGLLVLATMAFGSQPAQTAVTEAWVQRYGSEAGSEDRANKVVTDAVGNVIVAGSTDNQARNGSDLLVIKYSGAGVPLWTNRTANSGASAMAVNGSGNVFVTGSSGGGYATIAYSGAGLPLWTNRYNGTGNGADQATAVAVDPSGNVFVTGSSVGSGGSSEYATIAYSGEGVPLWTNRYNGPQGHSQATAMAVDPSGNVFVTGSSLGGAEYDYATIAYSGTGLPLWTNRYNGPANGYDQATAMAVDRSGNVFVTGNSAGSGVNNADYATIAYSGAGVPLWTNRYNGGGWDYATAVAVDGSGNVFVTGWSGYSSGGGSNNDYATIAYSSAGVALWTKRYNGPGRDGDVATALAVDGSGNVLVTGWSVGNLAELRQFYVDYATIAYSGAGVPLWTNRYDGPVDSSDQATAVAVDGNGNVFVTGNSGVPGDADYATVAYSGAGVPLWTNRYAGRANATDTVTAMAMDSRGTVFVMGISGAVAYTGAGVPLWTNRYDNNATAVAVDGSGNVIVTGSSDGILGSHSGTMMYSGAGVPLWTNRSTSLSEATAVAVDGRGNVFVTGNSYSSGGYATIAYSAAGVPLWTNSYNGPGKAQDSAAAVAVGADGNVFVTGTAVVKHAYDYDYATIAYSGAGVPLWTNRYNGPGEGFDHATAVAVDGSGNVVVTGSSDSDYYTAKYAAADGALLWEKRYDGGFDHASALAVDGSGNVVVTGSSEGGYYTAKYAAADGALLWEKRYRGPKGYAQATAVAVDGSGNVVVTGRIDGFIIALSNVQGGDYYTAKYAAVDGATLWEKRFDTLNSGGSPPYLALGPNGMIAVSGTSSGDYATVVYRDVPAGPRRQLIVNGGFESPDTPTYIDISAGQDTIAPWVVGLHSVQVGNAVGNGVIVGSAFEGAQFLDLNGTGLGRLTQAFTTTPGLLYSVTFAYANNYFNASTASARVRIFDGLGNRLNQNITHASSVAGDYDWTVFAAQFTALQNTTSLEFTSLTDNYSGIMLDAVQVFEGAPEIESITRAGNGFVLLKVRGFPNGVHRIQALVDLSAGSFNDIATVTADAAGHFQYQDTRSEGTNSFYRVFFP